MNAKDILTRRNFMTLSGVSSLIALSGGLPLAAAGEGKKEAPHQYTPKNFSRLTGMNGFSKELLENHFKLYNGYVAKTRMALDTLHEMLKSEKQDSYEFGELKRRLGWEFNGMRLHELYFDALGGNGRLDMNSTLAKKITEQFDSVDRWMVDFKSTGKMRGIGWAVLYLDQTTGKLIDFWINEHDGGHPGGCTPLLIMDVFEHAFMLDYGLDKSAYIEAFFKNIDWEKVQARMP